MSEELEVLKNEIDTLNRVIEALVNAKVRVSEKEVITLEEAAALYSIGENKLRALISNNPNAPWIFRSGSWIRIKRKQFDRFIDGVDSL